MSHLAARSWFKKRGKCRCSSKSTLHDATRVDKQYMFTQVQHNQVDLTYPLTAQLQSRMYGHLSYQKRECCTDTLLHQTARTDDCRVGAGQDRMPETLQEALLGLGRCCAFVTAFNGESYNSFQTCTLLAVWLL